MATVLSHAVLAVALGLVCGRAIPGRAIFYGAVSSMVPDLDVLGFGLGVRYGDPFGHRGLTHSLCFAAVWAVLATVVLFFKPADRTRWPAIGLFLFLATASHGVLDALTDGGLGVAFFAPFDHTRYFFPWHPIAVSPIGAHFFSSRGLAVLMNEALWIWLPALVCASAVILIRRRAEARSGSL